MLIPDNIKDFDSNGERFLYFKFKNETTSNKFYILHSVFTNYHLKSVSGELDFLVLVPGMGIFAIEVKHGRVARKEGVWEFTNKNGKTTKKTKSPFAQVTGTMHSVRTFILNKVRSKKTQFNKLEKLLWGTGVAFTSMDEPPDIGQEAASWQILTKTGLRFPIAQYIESLSREFHAKFYGKPWYDSNYSRPTQEDCELIIQIIRGDFDTDYTEINKLKENNIIIEEFTREQFSLLDFANYNNRCLFEGGAGTGKTLLALELAKRKLKEGMKILFLCYNRKLGGYLKSKTKNLNVTANNYFGSIHSYLLQQTNLKSSSSGSHLFFSEELPFEFILQNEDIDEDKKFDLLIIDEAQDLITPYYLEVFDLILKGGMKAGKWVFFGDFTNQAIYSSKSRDELIALLKEKAEFVNLPPLKINCRNTITIARQNTLASGAPFPEFIHGGIQGNPVTQKFPSGNNYTKEIERIVKEILDRGIRPDDIILLSPKKLEYSSLHKSDIIKDAINRGVDFSTIQAFKGLEKNIVIIYDFDELTSSNAQQLLYIAISRARQELYIVFSKDIEKEYNRLIKSNINKIM